MINANISPGGLDGIFLKAGRKFREEIFLRKIEENTL